MSKSTDSTAIGEWREYFARVRETVLKIAAAPIDSRAALTGYMHEAERRECLEAAIEIIAELQVENERAREVFGRIAGAIRDTCEQCFRGTAVDRNGDLLDPDTAGTYCHECDQGAEP